MLVAATATKYENRYTKSRTYEHNWIDNHRIQIPWLNFLTIESIPEETDIINSPKHIRNDSDCSSSSTEESYIVLEIQRPNSISNQLNFAQINEDEDCIEYEQLLDPIIIEIPSEQNAVEYQTEQMIMNKEHVKITELFIHKSKEFNDDLSHIRNQKLNSSFSLSKEQFINRKYSIISSNSTEISQEKSSLETTTLTRTFTFNRTRMDKSACMKEQKTDCLEIYNEEQLIPSKPLTFLRLVKKRNRTVKSEYYLPDDEMKIDQPTLLQVKYFDGRPTLTNFHALESFGKSQLSKMSLSSQLNLPKNIISHDLSYRKRILNRIQTFLKFPSNEQSKLSQ